MRTIIRSIRRTKGFARQNEFAWRYLLNLVPTLQYRTSRIQPPAEAAAVIEKLNHDGVAISSVESLHSTGLFEELCLGVHALCRDRKTELSEARKACEDGNSDRQKPFVFSLLGDAPKLDPSTVWVRFALQDSIVAIAQAYFGMWVTLRYCNVWCNFVSRSEASQSQYWHRDPEDRYILKIFVCLEEVDDGRGPFTYAAGSHPKAGFTASPEYLHKDGQTTRSNDRQMAKLIPSERWVTGVGPKGTVIFADTRGYHKGGLARERERLLYTCEFTSPSAGDGGILCRATKN
jgi:hypothetical protein